MNEIIQSTDLQIGEQLTSQYHRAVSGMREVLIFGAMLMHVEENLSTRGQVSGGRGLKSGISDWLRHNAPEIKRSTAYRFLGITKAIVEEYESIVGTRIAKAFSLPQLVLADAGTLPKHVQLKQMELFDYVSGTSQRSWLDRYSPGGTPGGDQRKIDPETGERINHRRKSLDERLEIARIDAHSAVESIHLALSRLFDDPHLGYHLLSPQIQDTLHGLWIDYGRRFKAVREETR